MYIFQKLCKNACNFNNRSSLFSEPLLLHLSLPKFRAAILLLLMSASFLRLTTAVPIQTHVGRLHRLPGTVSPLSWMPRRGQRPKVWRITRYSSILGPTLAIFLYEMFNGVFEKYRPLAMNTVRQAWVDFREASEFSLRGRHAIPIHNAHNGESLFAMAVADDVIRIINRRLREQAVVSRIQMDDDPFEFTRELTQNELKAVAKEVLEEVLGAGSGKFLKEHDKNVVRRLVVRSVQ